MPKPKNQQPDKTYEKLVLLDRLEDLREDLVELGIATLDELNRRIANLEAEIEDEDDDGPV